MDLQFYGANCIALSHKNTRIIVDDNLAELGKKSIIKPDDVAVFTAKKPDKTNARLTLCGAGEYEVGDISIVGIDTKPFMNDDSGAKATIYKLFTSEVSVLVTGHIMGELSEEDREQIGPIDILFVPVGDNGYTLDAIGALKLIRYIEPKLVIPTHYKESSIKYPVQQSDLDTVIKDLAMEPREAVAKLKVKPADLTDITQLVVLEVQ